MSEHEREHFVEPEAGVIEGEDDLPRQPAPPLDQYTRTTVRSESPTRQRAAALMRWAWLPILVGLAIVVWAALR